MIYKNEARAIEVAAEINALLGYARAQTVLTVHGWTVVSDYKYGLSGPLGN